MEEENQQERLSKLILSNSPYISGGEFEMGSNVFESETPVHTVTTESIRLSKFLITKEQFISFLNSINLENERDGMYLYLNVLNKMSRIKKEGSLYVVDSGFEDHPVICVNWFGASAFAAWIGGRLPTEAEWEKACRGGIEGFTFPWGNEKPNHSLANFGENVGSTTPVGKYPPNRFGLYDMTGNTWEWCKDWYRKDYYKKSPKINPGGPSSGVDKVVRGGGWAYGMETLRCAKREKRWARVGGTNIGFRVAFDVRTEGLRR